MVNTLCSVTDPGGELGHPAVCVRALSGCIMVTPSSWIPAVGAADKVCLKSSEITHLCGVGMLGLETARYACGV